MVVGTIRRVAATGSHPIGTIEATKVDVIVRLANRSLSALVTLKKLGGRCIDKDGLVWRFPRLAMYMLQIIRSFPNLGVDPTVRDILLSPTGFPLRFESACGHRSWDKLLSYQKESVAYLLASPIQGSLLALSPGLGKTAVSIVSAELKTPQPRVLVVAPLSLLKGWEKEIRLWGESTEVTIVRGSDEVPKTGWVITNYDTIVRHYARYLRTWDVLIVDESIMIKSRDTQRFKRLKMIGHYAKKIWELSGSPTSRSVEDLWSQLHLLTPSSFTSFWRFAETYCVIEDTPWGKTIVGSRSEYDFQSEFRDLMFVRNQKDVLELPESLFETIDLDLLPGQRRVYNELSKTFLAELDSGDTLTVANRMTELIRLQQIVSNLGNVAEEDVSAKTDALLELLGTDHFEFPMVIWTHWSRGAKLLTERLVKAGYGAERIGGDTINRDAILERYLRNEIPILVLSTSVGGYGLTLTNTKSEVYYEKSFHMDAYVQSRFRVTRLGLKHSPLVTTLRCPGTVDDIVEDNLSGKAVDISRITSADLSKLLRGLGRLTP